MTQRHPHFAAPDHTCHHTRNNYWSTRCTGLFLRALWRSFWVCAWTSLCLSGCASTSVFNPWPHQAHGWKSSLAGEQPEIALQALSSGTEGRDQLLFYQERGRVAQLTGDLQQSRDDFRRAINIYDNQDEDAYIRLSGMGATTASLITNDNALPYRGEDHERMLVHGFQAMNYWALGEFEAAAVEFRRLSLEQQVVEQRRERLIRRAESEAREKNVSPQQSSHLYANLNAAAADVRSSVQNGYLYYLAGVFREGISDYNNAIVDYRKALELNPESSMIRKDLQRVSDKMDRRYNNDKALVVVAYEQGMVPAKREISLPIPTDHGYFAVAFPSYDPADQFPARSLRIQVHDGPHTETENLANISAMTARALRDRIPAMMLRQTLRASAKYNAQKRANEDFGLLGAFATQIYNLVSEQADLRSWLSLPGHAQIARMELTPGKHLLRLSAMGDSTEVSIQVTSGSTQLIWVQQPQQKLITHVMPVLEESP